MGNFFGCVQTDDYTRAITEKRGKFHKELSPGVHCVPWYCGQRIVGEVSMKIQKCDVMCESKTQDNVFVNVFASVHYQVLDVVDVNNARKTFYLHNDSKTLIQAHCFNVIKTAISKSTFDDLFEKNDELADMVNEKLNVITSDYGFGNFKTIITNIVPDERAKRIIGMTSSVVATKIESAFPTVEGKDVFDVLATQSG